MKQNIENYGSNNILCTDFTKVRPDRVMTISGVIAVYPDNFEELAAQQELNTMGRNPREMIRMRKEANKNNTQE